MKKIHHVRIFVTFAEVDCAPAIQLVERLSCHFPNKCFIGRHEKNCSDTSIGTTTLTLVIESQRTHESSRVSEDVRLSLLNTPPNQILRVLIEDGGMLLHSTLGRQLDEWGVEKTSSTLPDLSGAFSRADLLAEVEPALRVASTTAGGKNSCNR
ncbi:hypothetical protein [Verrucomicrobium sp. BvORR034]|uniref:hypothetical protein n=1 Tax=Verrucomicrobium sp. BvORR034 TaxID=1396418 RepID=UPI002240F198|nr:hypothetical protein [Verrucomicrobium sp. BvORR034]